MEGQCNYLMPPFRGIKTLNVVCKLEEISQPFPARNVKDQNFSNCDLDLGKSEQADKYLSKKYIGSLNLTPVRHKSFCFIWPWPSYDLDPMT